MGSHRRPRPGILETPAARRGLVGVGAAALASVTLLSQTAAADDNDDGPASVEEQQRRADEAHARAVEVREQVDRLYREAGTATQHYNEAQEAVDEQQALVDELLDQAAGAADRVNEARRTLGAFAAAQYRAGAGGLSETATLLLASDPQAFFDRNHTLDRLTEMQRRALADFDEQRADAERQSADASVALSELEQRQAELQEQQEAVQGRLAEARRLMDELDAQARAELAELERLEREEAERRAEAERQRLAEEEAARAAAQAQAEAEAAQREQEPATGDAGDAGEQAPADSGGSYATQAEAAIAFAEAQLGKPYVWGATGPNSYDCSGLTQAAWRAAGVDIPRVTWDQVNTGTRVARDQLLPGDLVFFYDDISHVGLYIGEGMMIHAPKPGDVVKVESVASMPWYGAVRPA
jgi:cell wall-associated NlpC family hydrolase